MFEQDYIMRLIKEMVRTLLKLLFQIDVPSPTADLMEDEEAKETLERLFDMIDDGLLDDAENQLYEMMEGKDDRGLEAALLFYSYLNEKDDVFLLEHDFCREEISAGVRNAVSLYGLEGMAEVFLNDFKEME